MSYKNLDVNYSNEENTNSTEITFPEFVDKGYFEFIGFLASHDDANIRTLRPESILPGGDVPTETHHKRILVYIDKKGTIIQVPKTG